MGISNVSSHVYQKRELSQLGHEVKNLEVKGKTDADRNWATNGEKRITLHGALVAQAEVQPTHCTSPVQETEEVGTTGQIRLVPTYLNTRSAAGSGLINYMGRTPSRNGVSGPVQPNTLVAPTTALPPVRFASGSVNRAKLH